jgi:hypothetical protein
MFVILKEVVSNLKKRNNEKFTIIQRKSEHDYHETS